MITIQCLREYAIGQINQDDLDNEIITNEAMTALNELNTGSIQSIKTTINILNS